jgi:DNA ligase-associated metallophosphoesterase
MDGFAFEFADAQLTALPSGALWWHGRQCLVVSDLHLGKSERIARRGGSLLPPYETTDTLTRLDQDIASTRAKVVVCLGDTFDDMAAANALSDEHRRWLERLMAGRRWVWIAGNHDPAPLDLGGTHLEAFYEPPLIFRHIATECGRGEVSGHYHPKARVALQGHSLSRPCFLRDEARLILPAYGTYTGGLRSHDGVLADLMGPKATAILTGTPMVEIPMPRGAAPAAPPRPALAKPR